jgi:magnesium transporter
MSKVIEKDLSQLAVDCYLPIDALILIHSSVGEALRELRKKRITQTIIYFYVVDADGKLQGVVSTRQLLLAEPHLKIDEIMQRSIIAIDADKPLSKAMELFAEYPLLALPVVDHEGKLLGTIDVQMIMDENLNIADLRTRLDVFQMIGLKLEDGKKKSLGGNYRLRLPWLLCNVFSGIVCAIISRYFEVVLAKFLLLAFFIPLVLTLSESASMQSMTQSLVFLRRPRFSFATAMVRGFKEWQLAVLLAVSLGTLVGFLSLFWGDGIFPSICIGVGITLSVIISVFFAMTIPLVLHLLRRDPKVASGPVVLMIADMLTTAIYLGLSTWWLI